MMDLNTLIQIVLGSIMRSFLTLLVLTLLLYKTTLTTAMEIPVLGRAKTTTAAQTTTSKPSPPGLCDGCLVVSGVGFNPYPGDCTKYVQCWREGESVRALVRSCPFGQFWDADAITCRPSFLVNCTADPCKEATTGFTYGMVEYGCRAYWMCLDGFSVGYCCPAGRSYVEGMGCLQGTGCNQPCPPKGGLAVKRMKMSTSSVETSDGPHDQ